MTAATFAAPNFRIASSSYAPPRSTKARACWISEVKALSFNSLPASISFRAAAVLALKDSSFTIVADSAAIFLAVGSKTLPVFRLVYAPPALIVASFTAALAASASCCAAALRISLIMASFCARRKASEVSPELASTSSS